MRVLILGSKGMLGQELVSAFGNGHEVTAWDREEFDVTNAAMVREKAPAVKPELIVNSVAYNAVDLAETPEGAKVAFAVNREAVATLAQVAAELDVPIIHFSTDYVFDGEKSEVSLSAGDLPKGDKISEESESGYSEDDLPDPQGVYAKSKYEGEVALRTHAKKWYLIRLSKLFGKPAASENAKKSFVDAMLDLAKKKSELNLVDEELSSPTYAPDLAKAVKEIVESRAPWGIYHRTNSGACTWYGFVKKIFEIAANGCHPERPRPSRRAGGSRGIPPDCPYERIKVNPVPASAFPRPAPRPQYSVLVSSKLPPLRPWEEALAEYLAK